MTVDRTIEAATAEKTALSRRSFVKWSAALGGAAALSSGLVACTPTPTPTQTEETELVPEVGEWIPVQCWADCGSNGYNKVFVVDGKPRRMGTDDLTDEDSFACPKVRSCPRGRAHISWIFSADRLKYPMKRKNWQPGGGSNANGHLRGIDEWERISWEEALDYIADEIKRIKETYGVEAIFNINGSSAHQWGVGMALALYGGYMDNYGAISSGAWGNVAAYTGLLEDGNDRFDVLSADLVVLWSSNPAWSRPGLPMFYYNEAKKKGTKFIFIDPFRNASAQVLADEWVTVRPATDVALALGMAYVLINEDRARGGSLIDWDFLDRCCIGFDSDHMPEGANPEDNFQDYVLGTYDGVPKDPKWAAEICGTPEDVIERVAIQIAETERVWIYMGPASSRTTNGYLWPQTILALGAMSGCIGKKGCMVGSDTGHTKLCGGPRLVNGGGTQGRATATTPGGQALLGNPVSGSSDPKFTTSYGIPQLPYTRINLNELWTSRLTGTYRQGAGVDMECKTQMYYHTSCNFLNQMPGLMKGIEAHRKVEFVVTNNLVMTTNAKYSDIVLPVSSQWERAGHLNVRARDMIVYGRKATEPLWETKDDVWIGEQLAIRLGVDEKVVKPFSAEQEMFNELAAAWVMKPDNSEQEPLLSFTQADIDEMGVEGEPQEGRIPFQDFKRDGMYKVPRSEDDVFSYVYMETFRNDPVANPRKTTSGKLEIYCEALAKDLNACGWTTTEPLARYTPAIEGYEETFSDWESKTKGEFPLQLVTVHGQRSVHSAFGNIPFMREAFDLPLWMNPLDAEKYGVKHGDTVLVTSKWGKILRPLCESDAFMPGVCGYAQGSWADIDEETGIDKGGSASTLVGPTPVAFGHISTNSCIIKVEKWTGEAQIPDAQWPRNASTLRSDDE